VFRRTGRAADGTVLGDFVATGIRPHCAEQIITSGFDLPANMFSRS